MADDEVDRLLARAKSALEEGEAREVAESLEKTLVFHHQLDSDTKGRCFRRLVKLCGQHSIFPDSYILPGSKIKKQGDSPVAYGGFTDVWQGECEGKSVAIRVVRYYQTDEIQNIKKWFCREAVTWKHLSHPNVLKLIGVAMYGMEHAFVAPWMENGNIVKFLRKNPQANPLKLLEDAARGLEYLHGIRLAHGDLKGGNILISDDGSACLADVGLTRVAADSTSVSITASTSRAGDYTLRWAPPERLDPERFGAKMDGPTKSADIYSMAMTIYEVLTDRQPFSGDKSPMAIMIRIIQGERPEKPDFATTRGYTEDLWEMTTACWVEDHESRPRVDDVLNKLKSAAEQWRPKG